MCYQYNMFIMYPILQIMSFQTDRETDSRQYKIVEYKHICNFRLQNNVLHQYLHCDARAVCCVSPDDAPCLSPFAETCNH